MVRYEQQEVEIVVRISFMSSGTTDAHMLLALVELRECTQTHLNETDIKAANGYREVSPWRETAMGKGYYIRLRSWPERS
jgi:hypothetical protein